MAALDRSPSMRSLTEVHKDVSSASSSLLDVDGGDSLRSCRRSRSPQQRRLTLPPESNDKGDEAPKPTAKEVAAVEQFSYPSEVVMSLEQHYIASVQQLEKFKQMYFRLDSHNDDLENVFVVLHSRLDAFRSFLIFRLSKTAKDLRGELGLLRDTVSFLLDDFAESMRQCRKHLMSHIQPAGARVGLPPLPFAPFQLTSPGGTQQQQSLAANNREEGGSYYMNPLHAGGKVNPMEGSPYALVGRRESLVHTPPRSSSSIAVSMSSPGEAARLREALDEAVRKREDLEEKLLRQQESYEKHMQGMKELYTQKERTMQERIRLLEHFVKYNVPPDECKNNLNIIMGDGDNCSSSLDNEVTPETSEGNSREVLGEGKYHHRDRPLSTSTVLSPPLRASCLSIIKNSSDDDDAHTNNVYNKNGTSPSLEVMQSVTDQASMPSERKGETTRSSHHSHSRYDFRPEYAITDPWTLRNDVERRVQSKVLSRGGIPPRGRKGHHAHSAQRKRREEKQLEEAASRLLDAVTASYVSPSDDSQLRGNQRSEETQARRHAAGSGGNRVVDRLYHLTRSPPRRPDTNTYIAPILKSGLVPRPEKLSDVSTVARGLWAEKLLQERAARQPR